MINFPATRLAVVCSPAQARRGKELADHLDCELIVRKDCPPQTLYVIDEAVYG